MPGIDIFLPSLFPRMAKDNSEAHAAEWSSQAAIVDTPQEDPSSASESKGAWAKDTVTLTFKNAQSVTQSVEPTGANGQSERIVCTSEAYIRVGNRSKLSNLSGRVDRNIHYNPNHGEFTFTINHALGTSALPVLKSRIRAIDRFVCFLEALEKCKDTIMSEEVGLRGVSFTYGDKQPTSTSRTYRAKLDLSKDEVNVELESGNPHLRVMDILRRVVNTEGGIQSLMHWLPASLSAHRTLSEMEKQWSPIQASGQGHIEIEIILIDQIRIEYCLLSKDDVERKLILEARVRTRQKEKYWHLKRIDDGSPQDPFGTTLKPIWDMRGEGWHGLHTGATGKVFGGAAHMLETVDEAIRGLVGNLDGEDFVVKQNANPPPQQPQQGQNPAPSQQQAGQQPQLPPAPQLQQPPPPKNLGAKKKQVGKPAPTQSGKNADQAIEIG